MRLSSISGSALLVLLTLVGCIETAEVDETGRDIFGAINDGGQLGVLVVRVGDCVNFPGGTAATGTLKAIDGVSCDQPHDGEAYAKFDEVELDSYDENRMVIRAEVGCLDRWRSAVGTDYYQDLDHDLFMMYPTDVGWRRGDQEVVCFVIRLDGHQLDRHVLLNSDLNTGTGS